MREGRRSLSKCVLRGGKECGKMRGMEKRFSYYVRRLSVLAWITAILMVGAVACRIAFFCGKGADSGTVWLQLILPSAACLIFCLIVLLDGNEHLYKTTTPVALYALYAAILSLRLPFTSWPKILCWIAALVFVVIYNVSICGKVKRTWLLILVLLAILGTMAYFWRREFLAQWNVNHLRLLAEALPVLAVLLTIIGMRPHLDGEYHPTWGDRKDGRRVRTLAPITYVTPYIMPNRNGASNFIRNSIEITEVEKYIHQKRREGLQNFGITHVFLAGYVRCVAKYPALNRFLSGQRIYSRDRDIQFNMIIKKDMTVEAPDTAIKLHLDPADTVYEVYEKFNAAVEEVKNTPLNSDMDQTARFLTYIPGPLLKLVVWILKTMDYFGLLPKFLLEVSPFHGSIFFTSMGSLGIPAIVHHLYDFGNMPIFCAFGRKRRENELNLDGTITPRKYVDYSFNLDERTVDGFYYATVLRYFHRLLAHPEQLDIPPEHVERDVD